MIKIENTEIVGWRPTIRGMRNPKNSWDKSDSIFLNLDLCDTEEEMRVAKMCGDKLPIIKTNDHNLMSGLANGGPVHAKYRRYIDVYVDITAPLYFWKEFKTYRKGKKFVDDEDFYSYDGDEVLEDFIEMNSCSTMHKIHSKPFTRDDFSHEHLNNSSLFVLDRIIHFLNVYRDSFLITKNKDDWWQMIQLLPSSYNQLRTVKLNYEVLGAMYHWRKNHKLDEWRDFCKWIESLPYSEIITGVKEDTNSE